MVQGESGDSEVENKLKKQIQIPKNTLTQFPSSISQKLPLAIDKFWNIHNVILRGVLRFDREILKKEH